MKPIIKIPIVAILCLLFMTCNLFHTTEIENGNQPQFGLYLLQDETQSVGDVAKVNLYALELQYEPFISDKDIKKYHWLEQTIELNPDVAVRLHWIADSCCNLAGFPFVVTAESKRIYLGAFWWAHSSIAPLIPHINLMLNSINNEDTCIVRIEESWLDEFIDPRFDPRILSALLKADVVSITK